MKNQKIKISNSKNKRAESFILMLARVIGKLFKELISFDENILSRLVLDCFSISSRSFLDWFSMTSRCKLDVSSMTSRFKISGFIKKYISAIPRGYFKKIPQYMPRAPD